MPNSKERTLTAGVLNIVAHPHLEWTYYDLLRAATSKRHYVKYGRNRYAYISYFDRTHDNFCVGEVFTFTDFDRTKPWLDEQQQKAITAEDIKGNFPEHLKPEFESFSFILIEKEHRIIIDTSQVKIHSAHTIFLSSIFRPEVLEKVGVYDFSLTIEQSREGLEKIFGMMQIRELTVVITRPNMDTLDDFDIKVEQELAEQHASEFRQILKADSSGSGVTPNSTIKKYAEHSLSNGYTSARGYVNDTRKVKELRSKDHPFVETAQFYPDEERSVNVLKRISGMLLAKVLKRKN